MAYLHIRELRNGHMVSENGNHTVVDVFFSQRVIDSISNGDPEEDGLLICVHWEHDERYISSMSLLPHGEHYESLFTRTLIQHRSDVNTLIRDIYDTCGLMLCRVTVRPLAFVFLHGAADSFHREGKQLLRFFKEFYHHFLESVPNLSMQVKKLGSNKAACKSVRHLKFEETVNRRTLDDSADKTQEETEESIQLQFATLESMMREQDNFMEKNFSVLRNQAAEFRTGIRKLVEELNERRKYNKMRKGSSAEGEHRSSIAEQATQVQNESVLVVNTPGENKEAKKDDAPLQQNEVKKSQERTPVIRLPKDFSYPKGIPSATVEDYRKTQRETGVTKDDQDPIEADDVGDIVQAVLARERERLLMNTEFKKVKVGKTKCSRDSILCLLTNEAFISNRKENSGLWFGMDNALRSERGPMSKTAVDTVICIHTSGGIGEWAFQTVKETVLSLLGGLEDIAEKHRMSENVGFVAPGGKNPVLHHLTNTYAGIREALDKFDPNAQSSLVKALIFSLACFTRGGMCTIGNLRIAPRLIMMTDGMTSDDIDNDDKKRNLFSAVRAMGGDHIRKTIIDPVVWIPIGNANKDFIKELAAASNGAYMEVADISGLCSYQKIKRVSANVLNFMMALGIDAGEMQFEAAFDACGQDLEPDEKYTVAHFVAEKLCHKHHELGEMGNFDNILLHDDLPPLGSRVVRGPDWTYGDQGSGFPGTVVNHGETGETVWVVWDNNMCGQYGYSVNAGYGILVCDTPRALQMSGLMEIGVQVERGPDWKYGDEDGGPRSRGVVIRRKGEQFKVRWENGSIHDYTFCEQRFDIWVISPDEM